MNTPLQRIRRGALVLVAVVALSVVGYRYLGEGYGWIDALWMVVITISTVGYGEASELSSAMQLFSVGVILLGLTASAYTFGGLVQLVVGGELDRMMGRRRMARDIEQLKEHVIICGYGRMGRNLSLDLHRQGRSLIVVDNDAQKLEEAASHGMVCIQGDATEEDLLLAAHVDRAKTLVTALPTDAANVFITLTVRNVCPDIQIIARAEHQSTEKKLRQAGANRIVMPAIVGARQMVRMITRPSTADLMELVAESNFTDLELDEIVVSKSSSLIGVTVAETEAHRRHGLLVVAVKRPDGQMTFNPDASYTFQAHDIVMVMGHFNDIRKFGDRYQG